VATRSCGPGPHHGASSVGVDIGRHIVGGPVGYVFHQCGIPVACQQRPLGNTDEVVEAFAKLEQKLGIGVVQAGGGVSSKLKSAPDT
jgi:hypothetical protein